MRFPFIGPTYQAQATTANAQRTQNWAPERDESESGQNQWHLLPTPGKSAFATVANKAAVRALFSKNGRVFCVIDDTFYELASNGTLTAYAAASTPDGKLLVDGNPATICTNGRGGNQLFITSGGAGYVFNLNTLALTKITAAGFPANVSMGAFFDQYFIALVSGTSQFNISGLSNGLAWAGGDVSLNRTQATDNYVALVGNHRELWMLGDDTTDLYYDAGSLFPFQVIPGVFVEFGCVAPFSVAKMDNTIFWLGKSERGSGSAYIANGYTPVRISNHGVEALWAKFSTTADAIGWTAEERGHSKYYLYFPTGDATFVYDAATKMWYEKCWLNAADGLNHADRARNHVFCFGKHLVGDRMSGTIYQESESTYDDFGGAIRRVRRAPHLGNEGKTIFYGDAYLLMDTGLALQAGQGSNPMVMLRTSDDGGITWNNERLGATGTVGQYKFRVAWQQLGSAKDRVFEVATSDPIPWRLTDFVLQNTEVGEF